MIGRTAFPLALVELEPNQTLARDGYSVTAFRVEHSVPAYGYALVEEERPGRFDEQRAVELGVAPGPDFGRLQRGESVNGVKPSQVLGDPRRGRKLVIVGDTAPCETTRVAAHEADLLIHEASFMQEEKQRAVETGHSTAHEVAELAKEAEAKLLALVHVSTRYAGPELRDEARAVFPNTIVPYDFDRIEIPFPERGARASQSLEGRNPRE